MTRILTFEQLGFVVELTPRTEDGMGVSEMESFNKTLDKKGKVKRLMWLAVVQTADVGSTSGKKEEEDEFNTVSINNERKTLGRGQLSGGAANSTAALKT